MLKDLLRKGARKTPSQHILIWCIVPFGLEIINNISILPACRLSVHREVNCNALTGHSLRYE